MPIKQKYKDILLAWQPNVTSALTKKLADSLNIIKLEWQKKQDSNKNNTTDLQHYIEAQNMLLQYTDKILSEFSRLLSNTIINFPAQQTLSLIHNSNSTTTANFGLIEDEVYEHDIVLENMAGHSAIENHQVLHELIQRLTIINNGHPVKLEDIPASPQLVTAAFAQAMEDLIIERKLLADFYQIFNSQVLSQLQYLYKALNISLIDAGVLPNLKHEAKQHEHYETPIWLKQSNNRRKINDDNKDQIIEQTPYEAPSVDNIEVDIDIEIEDIHIKAPVDLTNDSGKLESREDILDKVGLMLGNQRQQIIEHLSRENFTAEQQQILSQMGYLFDALLKDIFLPDIGKALLSRIHTPFIIITLRNHEILFKSESPVYKLFNELIDSARIWISGAALNNGIYPVIKMIVDDIVNNKITEINGYSDALSKLHIAKDQLRKKAFALEKRTIDIEKGQSKLKHAKLKVSTLTAEIFQNKPISKKCNNFIETIWLDYLTLLLLRDDELTGPENIHIAQATGELILKMDQKAVTGSLDENNLSILKKRIDNEITALIPHHKKSIEDYLQSLQSPILETIRFDINNTDPSYNDKTQPADEIADEHLIKTLRHSPLGSYFLFNDEDGKSKMTHLSWYNKLTDEFLFTDHTGRKYCVLETPQLASHINNQSIYLYRSSDRNFLKSHQNKMALS